MTETTDHVKGFGMVRLKLLLALTRSPELDCPAWSGQFLAWIGGNGSVKTACHAAPREARLDDGEPGA